IKGKVAYASPEQVLNQTLDFRTDIYGLGVVLYELASGARPFEADSEVGMMQAIAYTAPKPIRQRQPDVPDALVSIIDRAMARDRQQRYQSCREMQADLERFVQSSGQSATAYELGHLVAELGPFPVGRPSSSQSLPGARPLASVEGSAPPSANGGG